MFKKKKEMFDHTQKIFQLNIMIITVLSEINFE